MPSAIIYARYSSRLQNESSIEAQLNDCRAFCAQRGYTVIAEHADKEKTGSTTNRPGLKAMLADVDADLARIRVEMAGLARPVDLPAAVEHLHRLAELWGAASTAEKSLILKTIYARVEIDVDAKRITHWEPRDEFAHIAG
jgi:hypothetical protein